jgi:RNA polymerase-binding protein DksA
MVADTRQTVTDPAVFEVRLVKLRDEMTSRIHAIDKDLHHRDEPVEKDFAEQVTQGENDEVLGALDGEAKTMLRQIDHALLNIKNGTYGICEKCGEPIAEARLEIIPYATLCVNCAG